MKFLRGIAILFLILGALYLVGPRVENPVFSDVTPYVPADLDSLQNWIQKREYALGNVRYDNESKIYFKDSIPQKTAYSVLYLHGFTASGKEGDPVHKMIADAFGANLYVPRLHGHGLEEEEPMLNFNNEDFWESGKEAFEVAKRLGDKVIVLGTSHGGALGLALAEDVQMEALALFGPNIKVFDPKASLLSKPWGLQIARLVKGGNYHYMQTDSEEKKKYWTTKARLESTTQMQKFLDLKMRKSTFQKVKIPVFLGYYYKNDSLQDKVVSVDAMRNMFDQLGTPDSLKYQKAFDGIKDHVLTSYLSNDVYEQVANETIYFLKQILKN
ncbi:alpha/beta hydrolase [Flavobacteriaceae bacterium]|nr:alpha/beta hydrolase [Flavobacteriaceae bacterium]MDA7777741.1 alpha/beta hydrolase [Flavobacteriaceae bacterium]MDA9572360.1 alpha/beta hydrolase [Flavobacteriaceae bacterium]MDB3862592.1 alpha/beta hydrolase [Flavobacteriaceae bacterium]